MRKPDIRKVKQATAKLQAWYKKQQRPFYWRKTSDAYEILVSEFMLQQTQASRVEEKLPIFLQKYPTIGALAEATNADAIRAWRGMGYNNRAIRLRDLAREVTQNYDGLLPDDPATLHTLPGIGKYTAHAVACFGFRKRVPVVDVNIERVLSRVFKKMNSHRDALINSDVWLLAAQVLPRNTYTWNQALMELGSTICKARVTLCSGCPLKRVCSSNHLERIQAEKKKEIPRVKEKVYEGIPQRLWRGKIVDCLRNVHDEKGILLLTLGKSIKHNFIREELPWLLSLVRQLENDSIADIRRSGNSFRVMLAQ